MDMNKIDWLAYVDTMAAVQRLPLDKARREQVATQLKMIHGIAAPLLGFELDADCEPAGTFHP